MAGKLSPTALVQLAQYESFTNDVGRINALIEQYAAARSGHENLRLAIKRAASNAKLKFMTQGLAQLSQICGTIEYTAGRTSTPMVMTRALRENMGALKFQIEFGIRTVMREEEERTKKKKAEESAE